MSGFDVDALAECLSKTTVDSKKFLSFASQGLRLDDAESARDVVQAIENCKDLETLELKGNTLGIEAARVIGKALEKKPGLKRLLWSDLFTGRMKSEIPPALIHLCNGMMTSNVQLVEIDLSDNAFGPNGMTGLVDFLQSPCCYSLKVLKLHNNGLGITGGKMLAESLRKCYENGSKIGRPIQLKEFVSGRGRLENEGAKDLAEVFKLMRSLEEVHMPQNGINHAGITALSAAFALNTNLKVINLSDNTFTDKGSFSMAKALESLENIEEINFDDCLTRNQGTIAIANTIKDGHDKLKVLKLSGNEIELDAAEVVVDAIKNKPVLELLDLKDNEFGAKGAKVIQRSMEKLSLGHVLGNLSDDEDEEDDEEGDEEHGEEFVEIDGDDEDDDEGEEEDDDEGEEEDDDEGEDDYDDDDETESEEERDEDDDDIPNMREDMKNKVKDLVVEPNIFKLKDIVGEDPNAITTFLKGRVDDAILSLMKIAQLVTNEKSRTNDIIFGYADEFCKSQLKENENNLVTGLLHCLGLIKGEKKAKLPEYKEGPLLLLEHVVHQDYFNGPNKQTVWFILHTFKHHLGEHELLGEIIAKRLVDAGHVIP